MLPPGRPRVVVTPIDDGPPDQDQKAGLERLVQAVLVAYKPKEKPEGIASRLEFCRLWQPEDSLESFRLRTQRWSSGGITKRVSVIRRIIGADHSRHHKPYEVAQAYLRLHQSRRYHE